VLDTAAPQVADWDPPQVEQAVGWVRQDRQELEQWRQLMEVSTIVEQFVKTHGVTRDGAAQLHARLAETGTLPRTQHLKEALVQFVTVEGAKANAGER